MKTRKIKTKIWRDEWFINLSRASKTLFFFLISNEYMGMSGYAEIPDSLICYHTGLTNGELSACKEELSSKVTFYNGWVYVINLLEHDPIEGGEKNNIYKAYLKELASIPTDVQEKVEALMKGLVIPLEGVKAMVMVKEKEEKRESAEREKQPKVLEKDVEYLRNIPNDDIAMIQKNHQVSPFDIKKTATKLYYDVKATNNKRKYTNFKDALIKWIINAIGYGEVKLITQRSTFSSENNMNLPKPEELVSPERMVELRKQALLKIGTMPKNI